MVYFSSLHNFFVFLFTFSLSIQVFLFIHWSFPRYFIEFREGKSVTSEKEGERGRKRERGGAGEWGREGSLDPRQVCGTRRWKGCEFIKSIRWPHRQRHAGRDRQRRAAVLAYLPLCLLCLPLTYHLATFVTDTIT